ncbi:hypothetical protein BDV95DRAFT_599641 [Massariosphaeria phaeospora]|uniref:Uncharacterized protein n=1 Tax=Massariosphaeria phaeospora TaxID=100035 RepID=A0A7C8M254_9PLEO|nr:hypothetical protein BDV95DRAFT_599641 [Massariosphaeria phaeospora]
MNALLFAVLVGGTFANPFPQNHDPLKGGGGLTPPPPATSAFASQTGGGGDSDPLKGGGGLKPPSTVTSATSLPVFTQTVKTTPTGFSTESMKGITANTILHTTAPDGQATDVAVVQKDDDDDDNNDVGIILWGVPIVIGTLFDLPLPDIPTLYFPCLVCVPAVLSGTGGSDPAGSKNPTDPKDSTDSKDPKDPENTKDPKTEDSKPTNKAGDPTSRPESNPSATTAQPSATSAQSSAGSSSSSSSSSAPACSKKFNDLNDKWNTMTADTYFPPTVSSMSSIIVGPTSICPGGFKPACTIIAAGCWIKKPELGRVPEMSCSGQTNSTPQPTPTSTSSPSPLPPAEPTRPSSLSCYAGKVSSPFRSFKEPDIVSSVEQFCADVAASYPNIVEFPYPMVRDTFLQESDYVAELHAVHKCDDSDPKNDLLNQCKFAMMAIVQDCDSGSGEKRGGTGDWKCMSYKINALDKWNGKFTSFDGK